MKARSTAIGLLADFMEEELSLFRDPNVIKCKRGDKNCDWVVFSVLVIGLSKCTLWPPSLLKTTEGFRPLDAIIPQLSSTTTELRPHDSNERRHINCRKLALEPFLEKVPELLEIEIIRSMPKAPPRGFSLEISY